MQSESARPVASLVQQQKGQSWLEAWSAPYRGWIAVGRMYFFPHHFSHQQKLSCIAASYFGTAFLLPWPTQHLPSCNTTQVYSWGEGVQGGSRGSYKSRDYCKCKAGNCKSKERPLLWSRNQCHYSAHHEVAMRALADDWKRWQKMPPNETKPPSIRGPLWALPMCFVLSAAGADADCTGSQLCGSQREQQEVLPTWWWLLASAARDWCSLAIRSQFDQRLSLCMYCILHVYPAVN